MNSYDDLGPWSPTLSVLPESNPETHLIVASDVDSTTGAKRFTTASISEYIQFLKDNRGRALSIYEVIRGSHPHRLYLDIDGRTPSALTPNQLQTYLNPYLTAISKVLRAHIKVNRLNNDNIDMYVYSSSHETKVSFHVIVDVISMNVKESSRLVKEVIKEYRNSRRRYHKTGDLEIPCDIDDKVYNRSRSFRAVYSRKMGSVLERVKRPFVAYRYPVQRGSKIELELTDDQFIEMSVIQSVRPPSPTPEIRRSEATIEPSGKLRDSKFIKSTHVLYSVTEKIPMMRTIMSKVEEDRRLASEHVNDNLNDIYQNYQVFARENNMDVMRFRSTNGSIIGLDRLGPSHCVCCDKYHDNDNAYLRVQYLSNRITTYYCCHRGGMSVRI